MMVGLGAVSALGVISVYQGPAGGPAGGILQTGGGGERSGGAATPESAPPSPLPGSVPEVELQPSAASESANAQESGYTRRFMSMNVSPPLAGAANVDSALPPPADSVDEMSRSG